MTTIKPEHYIEEEDAIVALTKAFIDVLANDSGVKINANPEQWVRENIKLYWIYPYSGRQLGYAIAYSKTFTTQWVGGLTLTQNLAILREQNRFIVHNNQFLLKAPTQLEVLAWFSCARGDK